MKAKQWKICTWGSKNGPTEAWTIDYRFNPLDAHGLTQQRPARVIMNDKQTKYTPLIIIQGSEAITNEEGNEYAKIICDRLNAEWVKEQSERGSTP